MKIAVSDLIVRYMEGLGIKHIFGMPGAHILPVYDSLYNSNICSVLAKHEQGASFMASGYARVAGDISACITTAGPGATNLVTGIANAYVDKQPILIITGETSTHIFGKGGLQESSGEGGSLDQNALFQSITKYNKLIERTDYLVNALNRAAKILLAKDSGPVLLSIPFNVQKEQIDESVLEQLITHKKNNSSSKNLNQSETKRSVQVHHDEIDQIYQLIQSASSPVIVAGYGCIASGAQKQVIELSESLNIPVTSSLKGKGVISEHSSLSLGCLGVTSYSRAYQYILEKSDLIIFLGASFNERTSYVWNNELLANKKIIQIDYNLEQLEKVFTADIAVLGDIKAILNTLRTQLRKQAIESKKFKDIDNIPRLSESDANEILQRDFSDFGSRFSLVERFFSELENNFKKDLMIFDDNIIFAQNFYKVASGNFYYPNSGISSLGQAIPAAIGAVFAQQSSAQKKMAFVIIGDGGFQMCCMEIMTAVNYQLPMTIVLFNNSTMGLIRKNQFQQYDQRYINCDFINPDYEYLAKSFAIKYYKVKTETDLDGLLERLDYKENVNLIEIVIDRDVFPSYHSRR